MFSLVVVVIVIDIIIVIVIVIVCASGVRRLASGVITFGTRDPSPHSLSATTFTIRPLELLTTCILCS